MYRKLTILIAALALVAVPGVAQAADRDSDGLPDRWERRHHLSTSTDSANADQDDDNVDNGNEFEEGTKPRDRDSDDDGRRDGREDRDRDGLNNAAEDMTANDPTDRDTDGDGIPDGKEQAGVVSAYDEETGELTIDLANGTAVTAAVTDRTRVECSTEEQAEEEQDESAGVSRRGGRGCDGFDGRGECPEGTLAVGAAIHEAVVRYGWDGPVYAEIEVLAS
jgi:hypothetical protein